LKARPLFVALGLYALLSASGGVAAEFLSDLHDVNIGMSVQDLPASGYHNLSCKTSLYMRKKAYRLGLQAQEHYGDEGWTCEKAQPGANEEAIGPTYINDTCSKTLDNRAIEVKSRFFHKIGGSPKDFVSESLVVVNLRSPEAK
jgi:hypothetical protein